MSEYSWASGGHYGKQWGEHLPTDAGVCFYCYLKSILVVYVSVYKPFFIAQSVAFLTADPGVSFEPQPGPLNLVESDHEMFSVVIFSLLLIQEGLLSVTGTKYC